MKGYWMAAAALAGAAAACAMKTHASDDNSQLFRPARYALVAADVDAAMLSGGDSNASGSRKALFKLDSTTGEVWVLQLSVVGGNNPQVTDANWYPVRKGKVKTDPNADAQGFTGF